MGDPHSGGCWSCGHNVLRNILSLGRTPLANALLTDPNEKEESYPLDLVFCQSCSLVQITETVSPDKLFREYLYLSSFSDTMLSHAEQIATAMLTSSRLNSKSLVVEIGSNDGYLLQYYKRADVPVLGIEPAINIARIAERDRGITTICEFFSEELGERLRANKQQADVIHVNNVLAHVRDLNGFVRGLHRVLKDDGIAIIEVPYVKDMIDHCEFDTVYHEHLSYFSLNSLNALFLRNALVIQKVERLPIHGGTLRVYLGKSNDNVDGSVPALLTEEAAWGVSNENFYSSFAERVQRVRNELVSLLRELKRQDKRIAVYGASAKGSTLLNYCGIGTETLDYVVDRSSVKQGRYTPGKHLQIHAPEKLLEDMPDYVLLLTWNFAAEILEQQAEYRRQGGQFIVPIPSVQVI